MACGSNEVEAGVDPSIFCGIAVYSRLSIEEFLILAVNEICHWAPAADKREKGSENYHAIYLKEAP